MSLFTDVFVDVTKKAKKIPTTDYLNIGLYPIYDQGKNNVAGYTNETDGLFIDVPAIVFGDHTRVLKYIDRPCFLGADGVKLLKAKINNPNYKYLYYALQHADIPDTGYNRHFKWLKKVEISIPSEDEQAKIVSVLDKVNDILNFRKQQITELDNLVKARFVEMFADSDNKVTIGSICDVSGGYSFKSKDISSKGCIKILQIGNVYLNDVNWETTNYLSDGFENKYSRFLLNEGDIVVALTRPIIQSLGNVKTCIIKATDTPCLLNQRVGRIVPKKNVDVCLKFIYGCLMTDDFTRYVESCCIGCSQPNISTKDIENYMIPDVSYDKQKHFVEFITQVDKSKVAIQAALDKTQLLFDSLMQEYFG